MSEKKLLNQPKKMLFIVSALVFATTVIVNTAITIQLLRRNNNSPYQLANTIIRATDALSSPLVIEPLSGKAYIPAVKLVLPPSTADVGEVVYSYAPPGTTFKGEVILGEKNDIRAAQGVLLDASSTQAVLAEVSKVKSCVGAVHVRFQPDNPDNMLNAAGTKQLLNKTTAYFYTEPTCLNMKLLNYAKQINSY